MPEPLNTNATVYRPCPNCGDLLPPDARRCPHCGASQTPGNTVVDAGILFVKIVLALGIGLLVLPLGACGACTMLASLGSIASGGFKDLTFLYLLLLGTVLLALSIGGAWLIVVMFRNKPRGANKR